MESLESELERARDLDVAALADAIETIGFECTRCGACCKAGETACGDGDSDTAGEPGPHTATVFPDEIRQLQSTGDYDFRDIARPMPYGIEESPDGPQGETFEWALQTDDCGDCTFYAEDDDGVGACTVHEDRPLICRTYPFSVALGGTSQPMGEAVDSVALEGQREAGDTDDEGGMVRAHECEGLGRDISRADAEELAAALKERAIRELEEAVGVRDNYEPTDVDGVVVHDSEGQKRPDGTPLEDA
ncbi:YkgJ family cysteine cluster protein [Haloarcula pellucida]|uniref:Zinc/iron-chelating domain-containing protein n=1 Tax=Haloarcula pellucida TaxID=1427151 RepID=A0A830GGC7_9EURY|nr:YkgJ family cysteine cluster protein [Halomicroarcula pellucida]MBX0346691.1 YkgJ family cysteine cluster protein [Halomicroarcula pellucida]GGN85058.1 zinc/iron-chelating domain-containing protein [Halomicroarcula pellucida]